jgi:hypothetical protein
MDAKHKTVTTKREIFYLTGPTPVGEVQKAIAVALVKCAEAKGVEARDLADDALMVETHDKEIHIYFEQEVEG